MSISDHQGQRYSGRGTGALSLGLSREEGELLVKARCMRTRPSTFLGPGAQRLQELDQLAVLPVPGLVGLIDPLRQSLWTQGPVSLLTVDAHCEAGLRTLVVKTEAA